MGNHDKFLSHLKSSDLAVWLVAKVLHGRGYSVEIPASSLAERHEDWKEHADSGDLYIWKGKEAKRRIEVKHLSVNFSCRKNWPFGEKFIVCAKHSYDRAAPKPHAYIIVSQDCKTAASVFGSSKDKWRVEQRHDSRYENVKQEFYFAPLELVKFFPLEKRQSCAVLS